MINIKHILLCVFFINLFPQACVDNCMAYGSTIQNIFPYNEATFFYLYTEADINDCKQCYFSISVPSINTFTIGIYDPHTYNKSSATTTSDLNLNSGFTTCQPGYCTVFFSKTGAINSVSIQTFSAPKVDGCIFNNSHCSSTGIVTSSMIYSYGNPKYYYSMKCTL
jgi:hypothetical protein